MKHKVSHHLDKATAKRATEAAIAAYAERFAEYHPSSTWLDEDRAEISFSAKGVHLKGMLELVEGGVELSLDVPFVFKFIQKKAVAVIEEEIARWIGKAERGEL